MTSIRAGLSRPHHPFRGPLTTRRHNLTSNATSNSAFHLHHRDANETAIIQDLGPFFRIRSGQLEHSTGVTIGRMSEWPRSFPMLHGQDRPCVTSHQRYAVCLPHLPHQHRWQVQTANCGLPQKAPEALTTIISDRAYSSAIDIEVQLREMAP